MKIILLSVLISSLFLISCKKEVKTDDSQVSMDSTSTSSKEKSFSKKELIGDWIIEGQYADGFQLNEDGTAKSINSATLRYSKWDLKGDILLLDNLSIGNHTSSRGVDTLHLESLINNELKLKSNNPERISIYKRPSKDVKLEYYTFPADTIIK